MFTEIVIPQEASLTLEVPKEMIGHRVRITVDDIEKTAQQKRPKTVTEALAQFSKPTLDTRGWKFNRDEANER
jgi:hypothetical protein